MAANKKNSSLTKLTPNSVDVKVGDETIRVATDAAENKVMNMILMSQMRAYLQNQLQIYSQEGIKFTPKELKDLASAARDIAEGSELVYTKGEINEGDEKEADKTKEEEIVDLSEIGVDKIEL